MKKTIFLILSLISFQSFAEMAEVEIGPRNKFQEEVQTGTPEEPQVDMTKEYNKRFYQGLYNKVQKSHPSWTKEEVLKYIEPLWYKKLELDKKNVNRRRPSLSNEENIKPLSN